MGKSTFFNRLIEQKKAIMDDEPGVTRDRTYGYAEWNGRHFTVIDTGGYVEGSSDVFEGAIRDQVKMALSEATLILFMVDCRTGTTAEDEAFARVVREVNKPTMVVANKADTHEVAYAAAEFYGLGLGEVYPISSQTGTGTGELLDVAVDHFEDDGTEDPEGGIPRMAILGRPNAGKSSFLNALLGETRSIVTDVAGTTRDAVNTRYTLFGKDFILTDTAGIRKKKAVKEGVEFYSTLRAIQALQDSHILVIMIDAQRGLEAQDLSIIGLGHKYRKGMVIMVNKWDLMEKDSGTSEKIKKEMLERLGPMGYIPIVFSSVLKKQRIMQTVELALNVYENRSKRVPTSELNETMLQAIEAYPPPSIKGKYIKIKYVTQLPTATPTFAFFCNLPQYIKPPYERYLENKLRASFDFKGVPIKMVFRKK